MKNQILSIENLLINNRGFVSKIPDNKKIVMIISGGLDSIVTAARLMEDYGLEIFPIHIQRGQKNKKYEKKSVMFFTKYFQKKYGNKFHNPQIINSNIPPLEFKDLLFSYNKNNGYPVRDTLMLLLGVQYAVAISEKFNTKIRTVYSANVFDDPFAHCSLVSLRADTLCTCINLDDWQWQISSPNVDPFLLKKTKNFDKTEEIIWASKHKIPIEKTVSCYQIGKNTDNMSCGFCKACIRRKEAFKKAQIKDFTKYYSLK